jgi:uncharacterized protein YjiS (DUF1127 family)
MTVIPFEMPRRRAQRRAGLDIAHRLLGTWHEWRRRTRERAELASLDSRMLKDIGLTRCDAEFLSNKPFWKG